jgi:tRNA pseudouridine55 synthase
LGRRRKTGRSLNGIFLLNKPCGLTSNQALQRVKRLFDANKAGHTGALDPLATGVLPLCFGESTKFSQFLLDSEKYYRSTYTLGVATSTGDCEGEVIASQDASSVTQQQVESALTGFRGEIEQVPSMYSALKHNGQPLYKLARKGIEVERSARKVTIYDYKLLGFRSGINPQIDVQVHCSKGTYIRSLADDLGNVLGCGAHVSALNRFRSGPFDESETLSLSELEALRDQNTPEQLDYLLKPVDAAVASLNSVELDAIMAAYFRQGQSIMSKQVFHQGQEGDIVRVFRNDGVFLGIGQVTEEGNLAPKRLVVE